MGKNTRRKPFDFTAAGYVVSGEKALLVIHKKLKKWLPPGGHIMKNRAGRFIESPEEAAVREVGEETGFDVEVFGKSYSNYGSAQEMRVIPESMHIHPIDEQHEHFGFDYFCRIKGRRTKIKEQEKCKWFSEKELKNYPKNTTPDLPNHVRAMAIKAIKRMARAQLL